MGRTRNTNTEEVVEEVVDKAEEIKTETVQDEQVDYMKIIMQLQEEIKNLKSQPVNVQPTPQVIIQNDKGVAGKKARCINLLNCELNVSTEPNGAGRVFTFNQYGDYKILKFDYIAEIVASYPYTMEHGLLYIADKDIVEELGLTDEYSKLYTKELIDELVYLRRESDIDLLIGMEENLRRTTVKRIAELFNANESYNFNFLRRIKDEIDVDIEEMAKELKLLDPTVSKEEKEALL